MLGSLKPYERKETGVRFQISKRKGKIFIKIDSSLRIYAPTTPHPRMTRSLWLVLKSRAVTGEIKPVAAVETKLSDKIELVVNRKITLENIQMNKSWKAIILHNLNHTSPSQSGIQPCLRRSQNQVF